MFCKTDDLILFLLFIYLKENQRNDCYTLKYVYELGDKTSMFLNINSSERKRGRHRLVA